MKQSSRANRAGQQRSQVFHTDAPENPRQNGWSKPVFAWSWVSHILLSQWSFLMVITTYSIYKADNPIQSCSLCIDKSVIGFDLLEKSIVDTALRSPSGGQE